ncbi:1-deoxyxylulose-5-phosphate synthase YajO-like isoform X2 [Mercenaria mercenaria]|uniref:1-deoxyxylulose-5-phosphate synthase YajO-like isoform X2 n=1 Tax=Mercenaria mercenaria TaxID=6596 RepID=UPI00234EDA20|nr:1-deoxyxylulose-5-phosphate synthase YajO-like isoform X2 [Mercenaria mercenaria]
MYRTYKEEIERKMAGEKKAEYNFLGKTGMKVSNICLGTMTFGYNDEGPMGVFFGNPRQSSEADAHKILDRYVELGGNFLDTANMYCSGKSEEIIGTWLEKKKNRDDIIIATKVRFPVDFSSLNDVGLSRRNIIKSCEDSLKRLQTDYIDLYQAHMWDNATPIEETLRAFDDLVKSGKIRYYGFCNLCGWQMQKIVETTKQLNLNPCVSLQQQYNLLRRDSELEAFMVCENEGMCVLPWSPLKGGMLTGKFKRDQKPDATGSRAGYMHAKREEGKNTSASNWEEFGSNENYWKLIAAMEKVAKANGKTVPQVALRWLLQKEVVSSVIIGCTSIQQLEDNMGASGGWEISSEGMKELDEAAPLSKPYPYDMLWEFGGFGRMNRFNRSNKV